jgi:ABC-type lipoprotein export system ATPase subunit
MRELIPKTGIIEWNSENINNILKFKFLETVITIVFQNAVISYYFNLKEYIDLLILNRGEHIRELADFYLKILNLNALLYENIANCSGGEKYRISLLLALLKDTPLLLLDEPTAHLDKNNSLIVLNILKNINNKVIIVSSHDEIFFYDQKIFSFYYL